MLPWCYQHRAAILFCRSAAVPAASWPTVTATNNELSGGAQLATIINQIPHFRGSWHLRFSKPIHPPSHTVHF
ncbi:hypothetical protein BGW80DRAFT_819746 [Lactifluus volemus]|nr:hypothetical protein BGW80DRAFT_819746 [Lactifluus volemus]